MERFKRGFVFWVLLLVSFVLPVASQAQAKKHLYTASISDNGTGVGSGMMIQSISYEYRVRASAYGTGIYRVSLMIGGDPMQRHIILCDTTTGLPCDYDSATGNLDIAGTVVPQMLLYAEGGSVTGGEFNTALQNNNLTVQFNSGASGVGTFIKYF